MDYKTHYEILCTYTKALTEDYNKLLRILTKTAQDDIIEERYKGQPRRKNGQFDFGKVRMSNSERYHVSRAIATDHPEYEVGSRHSKDYGDYFYRFWVNGLGDYHFTHKIKITPLNVNKIKLYREINENE